MPEDATHEPRFGAYWLLKRVARGGTAEIFRALASGTGDFTRVVAIKRMLAGLSADPEFADMFIAEAKITSHLDHANIVQVFDFGLVDDLLYLCMEYVQGINVAELIGALRAAKRPVPIPEVCTIIIEALYGLDQAHRHTGPTGAPLNIIHRDLTPSNLLLSWEGQVKIADFGIAKAKALRQPTFTGKIKGKLLYMSPEQAKGVTLDQRSDLFSLGTCLYELLTLSQLYPEASGLQALDRVQAARITPPRQRNKAIPRALEAIVLKALARDPDQRFQTAAEMRDALEELMFEVGLRANSLALADLLAGLFAERIQAEQQAIAAEVAAAEPFQVQGQSQPAQPKAVKTFVLKQADMPPGVSLFGEGATKPETLPATALPPPTMEPEMPTPPAFPAAEPATPEPATPEPPLPEPAPPKPASPEPPLPVTPVPAPPPQASAAERQPTTEQEFPAVVQPPAVAPPPEKREPVPQEALPAVVQPVPLPTPLAAEADEPPEELEFQRAETSKIAAVEQPEKGDATDQALVWPTPPDDRPPEAARTQLKGAPLGSLEKDRDTQPRIEAGPLPTPPKGDYKPTVIRGQALPADLPEPDDGDDGLDDDEDFDQDFEDDPVDDPDDDLDDLDR